MIRQASSGDYNSIVNIKETFALNINKLKNDDYREEIEKKGFLIPSEYTLQDFENDLKKIFFVDENGGKVQGFLRIDEEHELRQETKVEWLKPEMKEVYFSSPHACIGGVAVLGEFSGKGISSEMLKEAVDKIKEKRINYLFSLVTCAPVKNQPSFKFHERNGFEQIAITKPHLIFGIEDYQSILLAKRLAK